MEKIEKLILGLYETNCYLIKEDGHVLIVDPGKKAERIIEKIGDFIVDGIVLTHGHFDHIGAVDDLINHYGMDVYIDYDDEVLLNSVHNQYGGYAGKVYHKVKYLEHGVNTIGKFTFEVIKTPGHTEGSVLINYKNHLFTGDTLFKDSIGRTDLYSGDYSKIKQSLKLIKTLDPDLIVYPGHGEITTLKEELENNPYLIL